MRLVLVATVTVLTVAGCAHAKSFDERAEDLCVSGVQSGNGSDSSSHVSLVDVQPDRSVIVTGTWNAGSVDATGRTVLVGDAPYGWTCVVGDPQNIHITYDAAPTTPIPRLFGGEPTPAPTGRNVLTGEGVGAPDTCVIKGNISFATGERIYHVPGQAYYDETVINEQYGERWFCSEDEALAAGWRKSLM